MPPTDRRSGVHLELMHATVISLPTAATSAGTDDFPMTQLLAVARALLSDLDTVARHLGVRLEVTVIEDSP
ncbi:hypothetical protein [Nocardia puris]|uniref:Uncharacterized protein n=1 Tax=Nocardia puris TaxID=208602 RepID=A0A366DPE8_9NOCA|nr:hypothetical protein [Nocardia puris]RBO91329.1 hypothetical protein DFR74_10431 [Nocardia puris]